MATSQWKGGRSTVSAMRSLTDTELVQAMRQYQPAAWNEFHARFRPVLEHYAERARIPVPLVEAPPQPGDPFAASEHRVLVARALGKLDRRERQVVRLRFYADLTQEEIARRLGMSQTHASRLIASALAKLERELGEAA